MNKINKICRLVLTITDEDFAEMQAIIDEQLSYTSPLKMATMSWQRNLGEHNAAVITKLKELIDVINQGKNIMSPKESLKCQK